jgi:hypothetical protein
MKTLLLILLDNGLPVDDGIYEDEKGKIHCHKKLNKDQGAFFDDLVAEWKKNAPAEKALHGLWEHVNALYIAEKVSKGWDENAANALLLWSILGQITPGRAEKLSQIKTWSDSAWQLYYAAKDGYAATGKMDVPALPGPCPWHFADVLFDV